MDKAASSGIIVLHGKEPFGPSGMGRRMTDIRYYILLAGETGVFKDIELEIMKETLEEWENRSDSPSTLIELSASGRISGFAYYSPVHGTEFTFDVKWLVVDKQSRKQGIGRQLLERIETEILKIKRNAILTAETSTRKETVAGDGFYSSIGFSLIGHIPDFYGAGDDFLMYAKHLRPPEEAAEKSGEDGDSGSEAPKA
jgi:ribosomal protein S18 acetylase RimI-like enzyme